MFEYIAAKLHGVKITQKEIDYHGSITIDRDLLEQANIPAGAFVYIWNKTNGERISTYVIPGPSGSKGICLNGSAARTCEVGDEVIIALSSYQHAEVMKNKDAIVLTFDHTKQWNTVSQVILYHWDASGEFSIIEKESLSDSQKAQSLHDCHSKEIAPCCV